jgi:hypothetical protein
VLIANPLLLLDPRVAIVFGLINKVGSGAGQIKAKNPTTSKQWQVLQLPTGAGKTQGACVYASMVAKGNQGLSGEFAFKVQFRCENII